MKKFLLILAFALAMLALGVWLARGWIVEKLTFSYLAEIQTAAQGAGLKITQLHFDRATCQLPPSASWLDWNAIIEPPTVAASPSAIPPPPLHVTADALRLDLVRWSDRTLDVHLVGLRITQGLGTHLISGMAVPDTEDGVNLRIDRLTEGLLDLPAVTLGAHPGAAVRSSSTALREFLTRGVSKRDLRFSGRIEGSLDHRPFSLRLETERVDNVSRLRASREDIQALATKIQLRLQPGEVDVLHDYPLRALPLIQIKVYAEARARQLARRDRALPEDATRHLLWSYWLTRAFGPEFAEVVTDAHETGASGNTPAEREMDLANNATARGYARARLTEAQVLEKIRGGDPQIVRAPRQ